MLHLHINPQPCVRVERGLFKNWNPTSPSSREEAWIRRMLAVCLLAVFVFGVMLSVRLVLSFSLDKLSKPTFTRIAHGLELQTIVEPSEEVVALPNLYQQQDFYLASQFDPSDWPTPIPDQTAFLNIKDNIKQFFYRYADTEFSPPVAKWAPLITLVWAEPHEWKEWKRIIQIIDCESSGRPQIENDQETHGSSYGLMQIAGPWVTGWWSAPQSKGGKPYPDETHPYYYIDGLDKGDVNALYFPLINLKTARWIWQQQGWKPWTCAR